jgi:predicted ABC-class ATPase
VQRLQQRLSRIDGKGYKAYKEIKGTYDFGLYKLYIDKVQSDPFAPPSLVRVEVPQKLAQFPQDLYKSKIRKIALIDYLTRLFFKNIKVYNKSKRFTGNGGTIQIARPTQQVIERNSILIKETKVEARIKIGLPSLGRKILSKEAWKIFSEYLPLIVEKSLLYKNLNPQQILSFIQTIEDQEYIRCHLEEKNLVAFIGDNSILPRRSGVEDIPMSSKDAVPFKSPDELRVFFDLPSGKRISGMGIPKGVTLIVGGGYHGKSTLLNALEKGVYNHIPGDGRELIATISSAVKIRAEDGRRVEKSDISSFIDNLPMQKDTKTFSTDNASGSTSQAANIVEAIELEAKLLLIDEDTSATNFMIRDKRMQDLVPKELEPITPFLDRVSSLFKDFGISTILVMGGCGDYLDVANTVILMNEYIPKDVTADAKIVVKRHPTGRKSEAPLHLGFIKRRCPLPESFDPSKGKKEIKITTKGLHTIIFGHETIDLSLVEQLIDEGQTKSISYAILYLAKKIFNGKITLSEAIDQLLKKIDAEGLDVLCLNIKAPDGELVRPRKYEIGASINRLRSLRVRILNELA